MPIADGYRAAMTAANCGYRDTAIIRIAGELCACRWALPLCTVNPMKPITTSVYTFCDLIDGDFLYVDKTASIHELIRNYKGQYFLARPRRFGKSLLISTLKAIFQGRRELFDGLFLSSTDYDWNPYPVIHLDLGAAAAQTSAVG